MHDPKLTTAAKAADNKLRLSADIITKAEEIANAWGLKNSRAAIEAVFRKYADDYLYGRTPAPIPIPSHYQTPPSQNQQHPTSPTCDALDELDALLGI